MSTTPLSLLAWSGVLLIGVLISGPRRILVSRWLWLGALFVPLQLVLAVGLPRSFLEQHFSKVHLIRRLHNHVGVANDEQGAPSGSVLVSASRGRSRGTHFVASDSEVRSTFVESN